MVKLHWSCYLDSIEVNTSCLPVKSHADSPENSEFSSCNRETITKSLEIVMFVCKKAPSTTAPLEHSIVLFHEFHETFHSVAFYFMKKDS